MVSDFSIKRAPTCPSTRYSHSEVSPIFVRMMLGGGGCSRWGISHAERIGSGCGVSQRTLQFDLGSARIKRSVNIRVLRFLQRPWLHTFSVSHHDGPRMLSGPGNRVRKTKQQSPPETQLYSLRLPPQFVFTPLHHFPTGHWIVADLYLLPAQKSPALGLFDHTAQTEPGFFLALAPLPPSTVKPRRPSCAPRDPCRSMNMPHHAGHHARL